MKKCISLICFILAFGITTSSKAQLVLLDEDVTLDTVPSNFGINQKHYAAFAMGYGQVIGNPEFGLTKISPLSNQFEIGVRYKRRLFNFLALGADLTLFRTAYLIEQSGAKFFPNSNANDREKFVYESFNLGAFVRINIGPHRNSHGTFIDLGGYGEAHARIRHIAIQKDNLAQVGESERRRIVNRRLTYTLPYNYGFYGRIGYEGIALFARYRGSQLFDAAVLGLPTPSYPRITIGLTLSV